MLSFLHHKTIEIFSKYQAVIPVRDRINGAWILDEKNFKISNDERAILSKNYMKITPCLFERGYCYFELGGFLNNSGGYCLKLQDGDTAVESFGFHRIKSTTKLICNWMYHE